MSVVWKWLSTYLTLLQKNLCAWLVCAHPHCLLVLEESSQLLHCRAIYHKWCRWLFEWKEYCQWFMWLKLWFTLDQDQVPAGMWWGNSTTRNMLWLSCGEFLLQVWCKVANSVWNDHSGCKAVANLLSAAVLVKNIGEHVFILTISTRIPYRGRKYVYRKISVWCEMWVPRTSEIRPKCLCFDAERYWWL